MASNVHTSLASVNLQLNAGLDILNGGFVDIYTGTQPANPDVAISTQTKLAHLPMSATAFAAASGGSKVANSISSAAALATGVATWARLVKSDTTTAVLDCTVGTSASDIIMNDTSITSGGTVSITSLTVNLAQ